MPSVITSAPMNTQRMRIVSITHEDTLDNNPGTYASATHYVYDIHGNVKTLIRDNRKMATKYNSLSNFEFKRIDYSYDLISGNVNEVTAQNGKADQWHQAYIYDADNRIKAVYTNTHKSLMSNNKLLGNRITAIEHNSDWQKDATYYYYDHGPLARVEIGENALQGVDYYYTLQGWLKGVNSSVLNQAYDPGFDSNQDSVNANFAKDVYGFGLSYYTGDYASISGATPIAQIQSGSAPALNSADLYNGNIRYMQTALTNPTTRNSMPMLNAYQYDQLNRLVESRSWEDGLANNTWNPTSYNGKYHNAFTYDAMGNILTQQRNKRNGTQIEDLTYRYDYNSSGDLVSNRLYHLNDNIATNIDSTDIDDMGTFDATNINTNNNYSYNASGQLVQDRQEEIDTIIWTASGKVKKIIRTPQSFKKNLTFDYGPMGNRIAKHVYNNQTKMLESSTYYLLDAQGNQLSVYEHVVDTATATASYYLTERNIYGSSRLGTVKDTVNMQNPSILPSYGVLGNRKYALTNHLNNVLTVISDVVYPISSDNTTIDGYEVGISSVTDYSPFGVELDGRSFSNNKFRYSFQNQEVDKETGLVNYKYRMHNPLLGRFLSIDPLSRKYPWNSSYAFSENRVIDAIELEGAESLTLNTGEKIHTGPKSLGAKIDQVENSGIEDDGKYVKDWGDGVMGLPQINITPKNNLSGINPVLQKYASTDPISDVKNFSTNVNSASATHKASADNVDGGYLGLTASFIIGGGASASVGIVWDDDGNFKPYFTIGGGIGAQAGLGIDAGVVTSTNGEDFNPSDYEGKGFQFNAQVSALEYGHGGNTDDYSFQWRGKTYETNGGLINPWNKSNAAIKLLGDIDIDAGVSYQWTHTWVYGN